jgi:hypothetical protein
MDQVIPCALNLASEDVKTPSKLLVKMLTHLHKCCNIFEVSIIEKRVQNRARDGY